MADKGKQTDVTEAPPDSQSALGAVMPVIADLLEKGTRAFALSDWEEAIENFGELSSITEQTFGSESPRYADCLVMYGRALLQHAIEQSALLAQRTLAEAAAGNLGKGGDGDAAPAKANINFEGEPDFRQIESMEHADSGVDEAGPSSGDKQAEDEGAAANGAAADGDESGEDGEGDEQDDFAAAWDVLDLARVIQEKETDGKSRLKYAETLMLLGDVSMESENFAQAVRDFGAALDVKQQLLGDDSRELAELYYKVALAHEYNLDSASALELMPNVQRILGNRLRIVEGSDKQEDKDEADTLHEVLAEVAAKIEEWRSPQKPVDVSAMTPEESALAEKAKEAFKQAMESGTIKDITSLVRPKEKRKPETEDEESKRARNSEEAS
ncbi:hypothetical protein LPJ61_003111 [Coemansia biformis]|uniref:Tetratricopeptide SHNi-TPR domain-containing protein n=1 Tax=Coemansia biformis TaxID=1286918 RepID=A0A9W8CWK4_9FUNG|nr:hypothetical protein LPJ61_003111 [Coemansia biformis]